MYDPLIKEYRGQFGKGWTVEDIVDWVEELPPMPNVVVRALRLLDDIKTTPEELAQVIMLDPALASPILRTANSAIMGHQREVTTLELAILVVGMGHIKTLLVASALRRWNGNFGSLEKLVWEKALGAATAARVVCQQLEKPYRDELHLTGLLHNLGQIVLLSHKELSGKYGEVVNRMRKEGEDFTTAEREVIGFSHPLVGALVAWKWGFPHSTCRAILHYPDPLPSLAAPDDEKLGILKLSVDLGLTSGFGTPDGYAPKLNQEMESLGLLIGYDSGNVATRLQTAQSETKSRFAAEAGAYN